MKNLKRRVKSNEGICWVKIQGVCPYCRKILGICLIEEENGQEERNLGFHKFQSTVIDITSQEIENLPKKICSSKNCREMA